MKKQIKYTKSQIKFLAEKYKEMNSRDLTELFNKTFGQSRTESAIRTVMFKRKIKCGREPKDRLVTHYRLFTDEHIQYLRDNYKYISLAEITVRFNSHFKTEMTRGQINAALTRNKISSGRTGCFKKGQKPWNEGVKGYMGPNRTSFKKGSVPANRKPLWTERIGKDGYIEMKVPEKNPYTGFSTRYKHKHIWIWEQHNNKKVPKGHAVIFKDSNNRNFDPDNLELVTRHELLRINQHGYKESPEEVKPVLITLAKVEAKTVEAKREL